MIAKFTISDMSCNHCKATIEATVKSLDPAAKLTFDLPARTVEVQSGAAIDRLRAALGAAGYPANAA